MSTDLTTAIAGTLETYKSKHETELAKYEKSHGSLVFNMADEDERKKARKGRGEVNKAIKALDDEHKEIKAPFLEASRKIDSTRKDIKDRFLLVSDGIGDQLKAHDDAMELKLKELTDYVVYAPVNSENIQVAIDELTAIEIDDSFCDKKADAALAKETSLQSLRELKERAEKDEELERLKKEAAEREAKEREERIKREAAEQAQKAAEEKAKAESQRAEREKAEALAKAEAEKKAAAEESERKTREAEAKTKQAAADERARIEREQREAQEKAEAARKAEEAKKSKQQHRAKIHKAAKESLIKIGLSDTQATKVVEAIRDELIDNVAINY